MAEPDNDARAELARRIADVRRRFLYALPDKIAEMAALAIEASGPDGETARHALRLKLHSMAGSAPTIGLLAIGRHAGELEAEVMAAPEGPFSEVRATELSAAIEALPRSEA